MLYCKYKKSLYSSPNNIVTKETSFLLVLYHNFDHGCNGIWSLHVSSWEYDWISIALDEEHNKGKYDIWDKNLKNGIVDFSSFISQYNKYN